MEKSHGWIYPGVLLGSQAKQIPGNYLGFFFQGLFYATLFFPGWSANSVNGLLLIHDISVT